MRTVIIDGNAMMNVFYYGSLPPQLKGGDNQALYSLIPQNSWGIYVNAMQPFMKMIIDSYNLLKADHIAICFDLGTKTARKQSCDFYKAQRAQSPLALKEQIDIMRINLSMMGFPTFSDELWEGDDLAATISKKVTANPGNIAYIITTDHDYFQLSDSKTGILMYQPNQQGFDRLVKLYPKMNLFKKYICFNEQMVCSEFGVHPSQVPDFKGIAGDSSDNIPGVEGIGDLSAKALLSVYPTVESFYDAVDQGMDEVQFANNVPNLKRAKSVYNRMTASEAKQSALFCKNLATMNRNVTIPNSDFVLRFDSNKYQSFMNFLTC